MKVVQKTPDGKEVQSYEDGELLFHQGEAGGDIYFLKAGQIEVFTEQDGHRVTLSRMKEGEILGVLTCLTRSPRMASARAIGQVTVEKVPHNNIADLIKAMPAFMKIVLKEFSGRLSAVNASLAKTQLELKKSEAGQITPLYTAMQMAGAMHTLGGLSAIDIADKKYVLIDDLMPRLETTLVKKREELDVLFELFLQAGVFRIDIEPDRKRKAITWDLIQRMPAFVQFVQETRQGPKRKLLAVRFLEKERQTLLGLAQYTKSKGMKVSEMVRIPIKDLQADFKKVTGFEFEPESLEKGRSIGLIGIEGEGEAAKVAFAASSVSRTLAFLTAVQKLREMV